jgi:thiol:disulfide interchange protein
MGVRRRFLSLGVGLFILGAVLALAILGGPHSRTISFICNDARGFYALGTILIFGGALWFGTTGESDLWDALLLAVPLTLAFALSTLRDLPFMWPNLLLWVMSAVVGVHVMSPARREQSWAIGGVGLLLLACLWYCASYLPGHMRNAMSHTSDHPAPAFVFQPVSDRSAPLQPAHGKVLVIDFAQTWCVPCRIELPQIARIRDDLKDRSNIQFVVVATDAGGDTPQGVCAFAERQHLDLPLAFDADGKAHAALGLHGFPSIAVLDGNGRMRFTHDGYNSSETDFHRDLTRLLRAL